MRAVAGPGHSSNEFVDYDATTNPNGTVYTATWGNDVQDELIGIQDSAGIAEAAGTNEYVLAAIIYNPKRFSREVGEPFHLFERKSPTAFDKDNPGDYFPAICLSDIEESEDIDAANYPDLVPWARAQKVEYKLPGAAAVDSWSVDVSGTDVTFPGGVSDSAVLAAFVEDNEYHIRAGGTSWSHAPTINIAGTDYEITGITFGASTVLTVATAPGDGTALTAIFYRHRIAGSSTTTARLFESTGAAIHSAGDQAGEFVAGMRVQGRFQAVDIRIGFRGDLALAGNNGLGGVSANTDNTLFGMNATNKYIDDGTNGTPRTGSETHSPGLVAHTYIHAGVVNL